MTKDTIDTTPWREVHAVSLQAMSADEIAEYRAAEQEEELKLQLAELLYTARTEAGLSQTEIASRAGTRQAVISNIENGAQVPTVTMLWRLARALDSDLHINIANASLTLGAHQQSA